MKRRELGGQGTEVVAAAAAVAADKLAEDAAAAEVNVVERRLQGWELLLLLNWSLLLLGTPPLSLPPLEARTKGMRTRKVESFLFPPPPWRTLWLKRLGSWSGLWWGGLCPSS